MTLGVFTQMHEEAKDGCRKCLATHCAAVIESSWVDSTEMLLRHSKLAMNRVQ